MTSLSAVTSVSGADVKIVLPDGGAIRIESARLFAEADGMLCRRFVSRAFLAPEIDSAVITGSATAEGVRPAVALRFDATQMQSTPGSRACGGAAGCRCEL